MDYDARRWYVLNHIVATPVRNAAQRTVNKFNDAEGVGLQLFAPSYVVREVKDGKVCLKRVHLTYHYLFLRGRLDDIKRLCSMDNGFSFLLNRCGEERYAVIDDQTMAGFQIIARGYENQLPYFALDDVDLEAGDIVEVVNGDFPGLVGTYIPKPKSRTGNIVLRVDQNLGTVAYDIKASDIRVIEFAKDSRRVYDQIDAFVPRLLRALRLFDAGEPLPHSLIAQLSVFCRRFEVVRLNNPKLEAKLYALLYVANLILGREDEARRFCELYGKRRASVSNPLTEALIALLTGVASNDRARLASGRKSLESADTDSKAARMLAEEYNHYLDAIK